MPGGTYTIYKGAYLPQVTGDSGTWGGYQNTLTFPIFDANLGGFATQSLTNVNVTLSAAQDQCAILRLTGTLTGNVVITTACQGFKLVSNATTGAYTVTIQYTGALGPTVVPQGVLSLIASDATNGCYILAIGAATLSSLTVSGTATFSSTAVFNGTTYTFGTGASSALKAALELSQSIIANSSTMAVNVASGFNADVLLLANVSTFTVSNWPASGQLGKLTLNITNIGAYNITAWPGTTYWSGGIAPTITSGSNKRDTIVLTSSDGGSTFRGYIAAQNMS